MGERRINWTSLKSALNINAYPIVEDCSKDTLVFVVDCPWRNLSLRFKVIQTPSFLRVSDMGSIKSLCHSLGYELDTDSVLKELFALDMLFIEGNELVRYVDSFDGVRVFVLDLLSWGFFIWINHQLDKMQTKL